MTELLLDLRPLLAILTPMIAAILIFATGKKRPNLRELWTMIAAITSTGIIFSMLPAVLEGKEFYCNILTLSPGINLSFKTDAVGMLFALVASSLWILTSIYSIGYMRSLNEGYQTGYYASFAMCVSCAIGIALSANLLTFLIFFELLTLATYPLVAHERNSIAQSASRQYLTYTLVSGQLTLAGIVAVYMLVGNGEFTPGGFLEGSATAPVLIVVFLLLMAGPLVKAGLMPFHGWLPKAMVAPTPVSALLHAVAVVKAGCFGVIRIIGYVYGPELIKEIGIAKPLAYAAGFTIVTASIIALTRPNMKQRLAYSTIGQLSYIILGMALATPYAILGAIFHLCAHAIMKITLFFTAGAIFTKTHDLDIHRLTGLGKEMPLTFIAYTFCSLGIAGLPGIVGFLSKWDILIGAYSSNQNWAIVLLIASALLACGYLLPIGFNAFRSKRAPELMHVKGEPNPFCLIPLLITATLSLILGIFPNFLFHFYQLAEIAVRSITGIL